MNVTLSALVVLLVEVYVVPRVTKRLEGESARRAEELHRELLAHSQGVAAAQRRTQALWETHRTLGQMMAEVLESLMPKTNYDQLRVVAGLGPSAVVVKRIARALSENSVVEAMERFEVLVETALDQVVDQEEEGDTEEDRLLQVLED